MIENSSNQIKISLNYDLSDESLQNQFNSVFHSQVSSLSLIIQKSDILGYINQICSYLQKFNNLQELVIIVQNKCILCQKTYQQLFEGVQSLNIIQKFSMIIQDNCFFGHDSSQFLANCITSLSNLQELSLEIQKNNNIMSDGLSVIGNSFKKLQNITKLVLDVLDSNSIQSNGLLSFFEGLNQLHKLNFLYLRFTNSYFDEQNFKLLGKCFLEMPDLQSLILIITNPTGQIIFDDSLATSIGSLLMLQKLHLIINQQWTTQGTIVNSFISNFQKLINLIDLQIDGIISDLDFENQIFFSSIFQRINNLKKLNLNIHSYYKFGEDICCSYGQYIKNLTQLNKLSIQFKENTMINEQGAISFFKALQQMKNLKNLDLQIGQNNKIGTKGAEILGIALTNLVELAKFKLQIQQGNNIKDEGLIQISDGLSSLINLQSLYLNIKELKLYQGNSAVAQSLKFLIKLTHLEINFSQQITHDCSITFQNSLKHLINLKVFKLNKLGSFFVKLSITGWLNNLNNLQVLKLKFKESLLKESSSINELSKKFVNLINLNSLSLKIDQISLSEVDESIYMSFGQSLEFLSNLKKFSLQIFKFNSSQQAQIEIGKGIQKLIKIEKLKLDMQQSYVNSIYILNNMFSSQKYLKKLEININEPSRFSIFQVLNYQKKVCDLTLGFECLKNLEELKFSYSADEKGQFDHKRLSKLKNLQKLIIQIQFKDIIQEQEILDFVQTTSQLNNLSEFQFILPCLGQNLKLLKNATNNKNLTNLSIKNDFYYCRTIKKNLSNIFDNVQLETFKSLRLMNLTIDLVQNEEIQAQKIHTLLNQIKQLKYLKHFQISFNIEQQIQNQSKPAINNHNLNNIMINDIQYEDYQSCCLQKFILKSIYKEQFNVEHAKIFGSYIASLRNLEILEINIEHQNNISSVGAAYLLYGIKNLKNLFDLKLVFNQYCNIGQGISFLAIALSNLTNLLHLHLKIEKGNQIGSVGGQQFGNSLKNLINLQKLNITFGENQEILLDTTEAFGNSLKFLGNLRIFYLSIHENNKISSQGLRCISEGLSKLDNLTDLEIEIKKNNDISMEVVYHLLQNIQNHKILDNIQMNFNIDSFEFEQNFVLEKFLKELDLDILNLSLEIYLLQSFSKIIGESSRNQKHLNLQLKFNEQEQFNQHILSIKDIKIFKNLDLCYTVETKQQEEFIPIFLQFINQQQIKVLNLQCSQLETENDLMQLYQSIHELKQLKTLDLSLQYDQNIDSEFLFQIGQILLSCENLISIALNFSESNKLGDKEYISLIRQISTKKNVVSFNLYTAIQIQSNSQKIFAIRKFKYLVNLEIENNYENYGEY